MSRYNPQDIAKGHTVVPSHTPMPGVEERPIDAGIPDEERKERSKADKERKPEPGISPSTHRDHLF